jgi:hypothetical protein
MRRSRDLARRHRRVIRRATPPHRATSRTTKPPEASSADAAAARGSRRRCVTPVRGVRESTTARGLRALSPSAARAHAPRPRAVCERASSSPRVRLADAPALRERLSPPSRVACGGRRDCAALVHRAAGVRGTCRIRRSRRRAASRDRASDEARRARRRPRAHPRHVRRRPPLSPMNAPGRGSGGRRRRAADDDDTGRAERAVGVPEHSRTWDIWRIEH